MRIRILALSLFCICLQSVNAQTDQKRSSSLGVSFTLTDYTTADRIKRGSIEQVIRDKNFADFGEMSPGLAVTYFKGLQKHIDLAVSANGAYVSSPNRTGSTDKGSKFLLEADASLNLKMFPDNYFFTPYLIAGIGGSKLKQSYGAIAPLGGGLKFNFFNEASLFITAQYRVGITKETTDSHFQFGFGIAGSLSGMKDSD